MWISCQEDASGQGPEPAKNLVCLGSFEGRHCGLSKCVRGRVQLMVSERAQTSSGVVLSVGHSQGVNICVVMLSTYMYNLAMKK